MKGLIEEGALDSESSPRNKLTEHASNSFIVVK